MAVLMVILWCLRVTIGITIALFVAYVVVSTYTMLTTHSYELGFCLMKALC